MKTLNIVNGPKNVSSIILGCMRMPRLTTQDASILLESALDMGVNFFDHADCYAEGEAEARFGEAMSLTHIRRDDIFIQSKCGLRYDRQEFDWTKEHILSSVNGSLKRLKVDYLDVLLLHRPDLIFEPEQVAEAFETLEKSGKVRWFGVSNVTPLQIELLKRYVRQPIVFNQLQFSLEQSQLIDHPLYMNNLTTSRSIDRDNGTMDYCRLNDITIQAWSPLQQGFLKGCFVDDPQFPELNAALSILGEKYGVTKTAIAIAWILRHPAGIQAVAGTMNEIHLLEICEACKITLTHHEWYQLYLAAGKNLP